MSIDKLSLDRQTTVRYDQLTLRNPELWAPEYGEYSRTKQLERFQAIEQMLRSMHGTEEQILEAHEKTRYFIHTAFDEYEGVKAPSQKGSFAFVVPTRIERSQDGGNQDDYSPEADTLMPLLEYVDVSTKQIVIAGMCPFVIDRYTEADDGRAGAMIFAPVLGDIGRDTDPTKVFDLITKIMNQTTDFAKHRIGVDVASFAAILPRLTGFGATIKTEGLTTTTGHGATVWLIGESLKQARERRMTRDIGSGRIGIIGTGAIGASTAALLLEQGLSDNIVMSDPNAMRGNEVLQRLKDRYPNANLEFTTDNARSIETTEAVVCAAAARFNLNSPEWKDVDFGNVTIIDDSQPGAFSPSQINPRGAKVMWPIGLDRTKERLGTLTSFQYGDEGNTTGPVEPDGLFGCEAEVVAIFGSGELDKAIKTEVSPDQAMAIGSLCKQVGITIAPPQCLGRYL